MQQPALQATKSAPTATMLLNAICRVMVAKLLAELKGGKSSTTFSISETTLGVYAPVFYSAGHDRVSVQQHVARYLDKQFGTTAFYKVKALMGNGVRPVFEVLVNLTMNSTVPKE